MTPLGDAKSADMSAHSKVMRPAGGGCGKSFDGARG